jgi:hypothetical protein
MRILLAAISWVISLAFYGFTAMVWISVSVEQGPSSAVEELLLDWPDNMITLGCLTLGTIFLSLGLSLIAQRRLA